MQYFKETDAKERKMAAIASSFLELLSSDRSEFYENAYTCYALGDVFVALNNSPLANAMPPDAFRKAYFAIHELFTRPGTFEFYLTVFRAIFGEGVNIEFVVPASGQLEINIQSLNMQLDIFGARKIINNAYTYDEIVDHDGDYIAFQGVQGIKTPEEVAAIMIELQVAGVFTTATLTFT